MTAPTEDPAPKPPSPKFLAARDRLPDDLKPVYEQFVDEYHFQTIRRFGRGYVAYQVLADLVLMGWRPSGEVLKPEGDVRDDE